MVLIGFGIGVPILGGTMFGEVQQMFDLLLDISLSDVRNNWSWNLSGLYMFSVAEVRKCIDDFTLSMGILPIRWPKYLPCKVNIFLLACSFK